MTGANTTVVPTTSEAPAVRLDRVEYRYDTGVSALADLSLSIGKGRSVGVVGPSGCGKSTLLYLLAGLREPSGGEIDWSTDLDSGDGHRLAMVFQQDTLLPWKTVRGNIELYASFDRRVDKRQLRERVEDLVRLASLDGFEDAYPNQLSGGMRRRVAFLTALAPAPKVLLLDEPFAALDEPTRVGIHQDIFDIVRRLGTTMILVTHDLAETISLCDEVLILTNRPGSVYSRHTVPYGNERTMLDLRHDPAFLDLYGKLWEELSMQIARTKRTAA